MKRLYNNMQLFIGLIFSILCIVIFFLQVARPIFFPNYISNTVLFILTILIFFILSFIFFSIKIPPKISKKLYVPLFIFISISIIAVELTVSHSLAGRDISWDAGTVNTLATKIYQHGNYIFEGNDYLSMSPNNIGIVLLILHTFKLSNFITGDPHFIGAPQALNSFAILAAVFITAYLARNIFSRRSAIYSLVVSFVLIVISAHTAYVYTDTIGLLFVMLSTLAAFKVYKNLGWKQYFWVFILGFLLLSSYFIKPTAIFIGVAFICMYLFLLIHKKSLKIKNKIKLKNVLIDGMIFVTLLVSGMSSCFIIYNVNVHSIPDFISEINRQKEDKRMSIEHFLGMGALRGLPPYENCKYGEFCMDMIIDDLKFNTIRERKAHGIKLWKQSVQTDFPFGYLGHMFRKISRTYSDGTFGVWREGNPHVYVFSGYTNTDKIVRNFLGPHGEKLDTTSHIQHSLWVCLLLIAGMGSLIALRNRQEFWVTIFQATLLLQTLFLSIFENRPRYMFLYVPLFILLAINGMIMIQKANTTTKMKKYFINLFKSKKYSTSHKKS